ncbi:hypothetical protein MANES_05G140526v8 [Manihot esculenta]|uniref:Uncharacterized protein n=2 Tax=Manihot esculenta TaxID=3983 RepID=A0ACB7HQ79_MANES|nr:hypothetical protein MANES_05G140526v8 [Manihot esculenta]KAG8654317.1 hypothetical protein MANES_05G140526v8 [Manihot esculenta]
MVTLKHRWYLELCPQPFYGDASSLSSFLVGYIVLLFTQAYAYQYMAWRFFTYGLIIPLTEGKLFKLFN